MDLSHECVQEGLVVTEIVENGMSDCAEARPLAEHAVLVVPFQAGPSQADSMDFYVCSEYQETTAPKRKLHEKENVHKSKLAFKSRVLLVNAAGLKPQTPVLL
eukprot:4101259-Amphidinium_carterae.1